MVLTVCLDDVSVHATKSQAPNYGGRVPVDTAPSPVPVYRALKKTLTVSEHCNCETFAVFLHSEPPGSVIAHNGHATTLSMQEYDELQLWDLDGFLTNCTQGSCWTCTPGRRTPCQ